MTNYTAVNYLMNNIEDLKEVVQELNSWDGSLEHLEAHENDEDFFNTYFENKPADAVRAIFFGDYKYSDEYIRFNGYANLETFTEFQYEELLKGSIYEIVEALIETYEDLALDVDLLENLGLGEEI